MFERSISRIIVVAAVTAALVALAGCSGVRTTTGSTAREASGATAPFGAQASTGTPESVSPFTAAAAEVKPSVVNVNIQQVVPGAGRMPQTVGNGSGIIISSDGYILTNDHVVSGASGIQVIVGTETVTAKIVGRDPTTDLAVVQVDRTGLAAARVGDPSALRVGDYVIAVGYPFGIGKTVTHGIVSALEQESPGPLDPGADGGSDQVANYADLIQTDAAINPGNSGGALATIDGRVIGVNTLIESPSGVSAGIGFAIPIDFAMGIADQLIKTGKAVHPILGVGIVTLSPHVAQALGVKATQGVLVRSVSPGGPAAAAGVKTDDVIKSVAGVAVTNTSGVYTVLRKQKIGSRIPVVVDRNGRNLTIQVTVGSG